MTSGMLINPFGQSTQNKPLLEACAICRGEGLGYIAVCSSQSFADLTLEAGLEDGTPVPSELYMVESTELRQLLAADSTDVWIAVVPLFACDCILRFKRGRKPLCDVTFPARASKVRSRLLTMTKPQVAEALRGYERVHGFGRSRVRISEVWPGEGDNVVWRVRAEFPTDDEPALPQLRVFGSNAQEHEANTVVMEDQIVPNDRDRTQSVRLVTFSCTLSSALTSFYVTASLGGPMPLTGFDGMNAPRAQAMLDGARALVAGATANSGYVRWFEAARATDAELRLQRGAVAARVSDDMPLFSLVVVADATNCAYLSETLESVVAQSYQKWELVIVDAEGFAREIAEALTTINDERMRVAEMRGLPSSLPTNVGIEQASGDYVGFVDCGDLLEPDALWCFWQETCRRPAVDLLYGDEDRLEESRPCTPAFKTFPNYGKLYAYNYIAHLLVVSRWALEHTERSAEDVAGAQDYDLTLRVFEVAREVAHVPRVLYHACQHANGTLGASGRASVAHEAGRRALESHLVRRGIAAHVEGGMEPCTYRIRYDLPSPAPKVSIVIPTRDHADLLDACVSSILKRSTYSNFEVVLVENSSTQERTFELYDSLRNGDKRVRVVEWHPSAEGEFNYSAIVNHGAACSTGEYLVLLNNDTEVLEASWIEEMMGCLMRPEVGVVGAKLLFGDGLIQHVGMTGNPEGNFCHVCQNLTRDALGSQNAAAMPGDYSMVTGACQMMRKELFEELGGYDEELAVGFNDGDFCLRARNAGYAVTVCAHAVLRHREFSSRGRETTDFRLRERYLRERARMMLKHASFFAQGDPAINPNLDPFGAYFNIVCP